MWRSRRYRSEWFTPWLMLTTTRWTRDHHSLHRWSTSSKMTSSCLIDIEGDTASQHKGRRQVSIQTTSTVVRANCMNYKYGSCPGLMAWLLSEHTILFRTQSFSGRGMYHNSATPSWRTANDRKIKKTWGGDRGGGGIRKQQMRSVEW